VLHRINTCAPNSQILKSVVVLSPDASAVRPDAPVGIRFLLRLGLLKPIYRGLRGGYFVKSII
jgi:hypothetical protein